MQNNVKKSIMLVPLLGAGLLAGTAAYLVPQAFGGSIRPLAGRNCCCDSDCTSNCGTDTCGAYGNCGSQLCCENVGSRCPC